MTATHGLESWQFDPAAAVVVGILGCAYLVGVRSLSRRGERWPAGRTALFLCAGLGGIVLTRMSFLGVYDRILFWPRAVQYSLLLSVVPLLLALGEPVELLRRTARRRPSGRFRRLAVRVITFPLVGAVLGVAAMMLVYFTPLYRESLTDNAISDLVSLGLLLVGCAFFLPLLTEEILPAWCGYALRTVIAFVDGLLDAVPAIVIMTAHGTLARGYYAGLHRGWGPSLRWDQTIGGGLMFTISELVAMPFLVALFVRWVREEEHRSVILDRTLDAATAATAAADPLDATDTERPWWEIDPGPLAIRQVRPPRGDADL